MRQTPRRNTAQGEQVLDITWPEMGNICLMGKAALGPRRTRSFSTETRALEGAGGRDDPLAFPQTPQAAGPHACGPEQRPPAQLSCQAASSVSPPPPALGEASLSPHPWEGRREFPFHRDIN